MVSLLMMGLSLGYAEVLVDSQVVGQQIAGFTLDDLNTATAASQSLYTRSLIGYQDTRKLFRYSLTVELMNTQMYGTESDLGLGVSPNIFRTPKQNMAGTFVLPREAYVATKLGGFGLKFGLQTFDWGLGILSNSGTQSTRFGVNQQGNVYTRLAVSRAFESMHWFWLEMSSCVMKMPCGILAIGPIKQSQG